ncbi:MAG: glycosyltransferase family 4 protein [Thermoanaerobaculia bacterium]
MKALIITARFPWPPYTGDRLRATMWLSALARSAEVTLVAPHGAVPGGAPRFQFYAAPRSFTCGVRGLVAVMRDRLPFQSLLAAPYDWRAAIARARREAGPFDVTVVLLSRMHPWIQGLLDGRTILDAVDSLRRSAEERRKAAAPPMRWLWVIEQRRMARLELEAARTYEQVVVVSEDERPDFGDAVAVTTGVPTVPLGGGSRAFDFGFWGRLPYFANADAVNWILDEIWPAIRALHASATLVIGGADAPRSFRNDARRRGVTLVSPIADVASFARNVRVALMPLRYGSGQSMKILEAAEAGCGIVGTPHAVRGLAPLARFARIESTAAGLARAAVELLTDHDGRALLAAQLRDVIETSYSRSVTLDRFSAIARAVQA